MTWNTIKDNVDYGIFVKDFHSNFRGILMFYLAFELF